MSCDDISLDVITISRWSEAQKLKRRRVENQQMKQSTRGEATRRSYSASSRNAKISSRKKIQAKFDGPDASAASSRWENQSRATVSSRKKSRRKRSVAPKWKEDKIAFWSAEEFWKLSNGKKISRGYILEATPIEEVSVHRERDALRFAYVDSFAYVEPSVDRYAYMEQLYLLLVVSRKEKLEKIDSAVEDSIVKRSIQNFAYVEPSVDRYAYMEQLYLLLVVSRKEKLEKIDSAVEVFSNDDGAVTRNYDVSNISRQLSGISNDDVSSDVITISRWIRRSAKEKLLTDEKNKGKVELLQQ
ncbi:hypothetical protein F511_40755 [Dorcoceras hygrometricum]|uniref:Uncharacterized protein n=1 Tax=Dorcoceras hygrometricum TaxID=472368 RepID=A0A2Z7CJ08_9LAMI|nr:hypothetical protein F511_40755 [Dorcoceras hygrometricum]